MQAAYLKAPNQIQVEPTPLPEPAFGEVRVKLSMIGVCGSDVHLFLGHRLLPEPRVIGHEGLGYIDKIGAGVTGRQLGERVVIEPNIPCRQCVYCQSGRGNICINKRVKGLNEDGCFAEYVTLPADFAWPVPYRISDEDAVTIEPMAVGVHALFASSAKPGDTIAVVGLGAIGLLLTHLALALGYRVVVTELNEKKRQIAAEMGATPAVPAGVSVEEQSQSLQATWESNEVVALFECAGSAFTASLITAAAPHGSEILLVGLSGNLATFQPLKIARQGIAILPSIIYDHPQDFRRTIRLMESGTIKPGFIVSRYLPLAETQSALEVAAKGEDLKIVIKI